MLDDRYELGERLAGGSYCTRYRATAIGATPAPGRSVTLAILPSHLASDRRAFAELSQAFADLRRLDHPHIVRLFELACDDVCYFTSEPLDGEPLRSVLDHLRPERLDRTEADGIVRAVGSALTYAHARGIVHGQVRAEHVVITMDHRCVLTDFLARWLARGNGPRPTMAGDVRALAQLALEIYSGLPIREALQRPDGIPASALEAIRAVLRSSAGTPSAADFLAMAGLAAGTAAAPPEREADEREDLFVEPPRRRAAPRRVGGNPARRGRRLALGALLVAAAAVAGFVRYGPVDGDWRNTATELQRASAETLRSLLARWAPPEAERPVAASVEAPEASAADAAEEIEHDESVSSENPEEILAGVEGEPEAAPPAAPPEDSSIEVATPTEAAIPSLSLGVAAIAVRENHGAVAIDVIRSGEAKGRSSVAWWTTPETADSYDDFASLGTAILEFPPGTTVRRVLVPLVDDGIREPDETFVVHLASRPRGATLGRVRATRVTVHDDD